jgi:hypothetical protein
MRANYRVSPLRFTSIEMTGLGVGVEEGGFVFVRYLTLCGEDAKDGAPGGLCWVEGLCLKVWMWVL